MKKVSVFLDSDVILDLLARREPFFEDAARIFLGIQDSKITAYTSPISYSNLFYLLSRKFSRDKALKLLLKLKTLVKVLPSNDKIIDLALASGFKDFEDSIQYYTALENKIDILITRNIKDYKDAKIQVLSPLEFIQNEEL